MRQLPVLYFYFLHYLQKNPQKKLAAHSLKSAVRDLTLPAQYQRLRAAGFKSADGNMMLRRRNLNLLRRNIRSAAHNLQHTRRNFNLRRRNFKLAAQLANLGAPAFFQVYLLKNINQNQ
jgi:hypothetical protein